MHNFLEYLLNSDLCFGACLHEQHPPSLSPFVGFFSLNNTFLQAHKSAPMLRSRYNTELTRSILFPTSSFTIFRPPLAQYVSTSWSHVAKFSKVSRRPTSYTVNAKNSKVSVSKYHISNDVLVLPKITPCAPR